jgi:PPM family protein phosphatase
MMRVEAAGATDTGQVRPANEDAYLVGDSVFAVADGMGGHLAGEVASATALEPIRELDGKVFSEAADAVTALREAVVAANDRVSQMAADEPSYRGMGTTLTATMLEGPRLHVAHVGDSRAYLLRDGAFSQLTDDHTLVQHLIDEGQITREEAAHHPQRSIITRAIGVSREVDVDSMTLDLEAGDQVLLCSDGLTGVVSDEDIASELTHDAAAESALQRLIDLAN